MSCQRSSSLMAFCTILEKTRLQKGANLCWLMFWGGETRLGRVPVQQGEGLLSGNFLHFGHIILIIAVICTVVLRHGTMVRSAYKLTWPVYANFIQFKANLKQSQKRWWPVWSQIAGDINIITWLLRRSVIGTLVTKVANGQFLFFFPNSLLFWTRNCWSLEINTFCLIAGFEDKEVSLFELFVL